jgi:thiol-disulfide isomerase/thioredoxin
MTRLFFAVLCSIAVLDVGCSHQPAKSDKAASSAAAAAAPSAAGVTLKILDYDGLGQLIANHKGKVVVLDCWSTSCEPCIRDFHHLVELQKKHGPEKVACISLSFDYEGIGKPEDVRDRVLKFLREQGATFDNVLSTLPSDQLSKKLGIASIPAVFVYDRDGTMRRRFDNENPDRHPFNYGEVADAVDQLLAEPVLAIAFDDLRIEP